jgi:hypothetical protein
MNAPAKITVRMCLFPAWLWDVVGAETGKVFKRFRDNDSLNRWLAKHPYAWEAQQ